MKQANSLETAIHLETAHTVRRAKLDRMDEWREIFESNLEDREIYDEWKFSVDNHYFVRNGWRQYSVCCCASFRCSVCRRYWTSQKVHILFHMKMKRRIGQVRMYIFKQNCKMCVDARYEEPTFQEENIEIAVGHLVNKILQIFYNLPPIDLPMSFVTDGRQAGPHDVNNCEGCALGICKCYSDIQYYSHSPVLPTKHRAKRKKKRFPRMFSSHGGASQGSAYLYTPVTGSSSECIIDVPNADESDSSTCCCCCIIL